MQPQKDGASLRCHLEAVAAQSARARSLLEGPERPPALDYLWGWFCELASGCKFGEPIAYAEIHAWSELTGTRPTPWEVATLRLLDAAWRDKPLDLGADDDGAAHRHQA